jgi:hypothetical protein
LEGIGILSQIHVIYNDAQVILDFHVFDIKSFDLMIGLSFGKFLREISAQGKLDIRIGKEVLSVRIVGDNMQPQILLPTMSQSRK